VSKIAEKAVCRSVFLTTYGHYILSAELTKTHSLRLFLAILPTGYCSFSLLGIT